MAQSMKKTSSSHTAMAAPASNRRQSTRQVRTSSMRPANYYARAFRAPDESAHTNEAGPGFFPAITHFTDSISALPKDMIQHFSMLKEVEAKLFDPECAVEQLLAEISTQNTPSIADRRMPQSNGCSSSYNSTHLQNNLAHELVSAQPQTAQEKSDLHKRQLFFHLRNAIASILPTLDEKIVVLNNANNTLRKGIHRLESSYSHMDEEISEEARYGSMKHWAYTDIEGKRKPPPTERSRREVVNANNLALAASTIHDLDVAASRSEARREAMLAKRRDKNQHLDSDFDDGSRQMKKPTTSRARKPVEATSDGKNVGLGISGAPQPPKKRKTEKPFAAPAMERRISETNGRASAKHSSVNLPDSITTETGKRKARVAPGPAPVGKKRQTAGAQPPHPVSSPVISAFIPPKDLIPTPRPTQIRARQNSITHPAALLLQDVNRNRPSSSSSSRPIPTSNPVVVETEHINSSVKPHTPIEKPITPSVPIDPPVLPQLIPLESSLKVENNEIVIHTAPPEPEPISAPVTTRAGRTSKPATPMLASFPDSAPMVRSRSTRNNNNNNNNGGSHASSESNVVVSSVKTQVKRSHKKGGGTIAVQTPGILQNINANPVNRDDDNSSAAGDLSDEGGDTDERYCYCNGVSYGQMIACDNENCPREWFHLDCVGLTTPPNSRTKWYCDDCKENVKKSRPGSSRQ